MHRVFSICALLCLLAAIEAPRANGKAEPLALARAASVDLWPNVRVLEDTAGSITPDQALAMRQQFSPPRGAYATLGMTKAVAWLRIPFTVMPEGVGEWILDFDYALLNRIDVYVYRDGRLATQRTLGSALPFATRPLQTRTLATPLELPAPGEAEILVRVETSGAKILALSLSRPAAFHAAALREQMLQGVLLCLGVLLVLYSLSQWAALGERLYLKYAFLAICSTLFSVHFFGIGQMYFWTDWDWPQRHLAGMTSLLAAAATALFVEDALAGNLHPWLRRALNAVAGLHVTAALAHGLDLIDIRGVAILMATTGVTPSLLGLPGAIAMLRRGETVGAWFILAWVGYFVASAILVGVVRGQIDANAATLHSFQIGATLDMVIFMHITTLSTTARLRERERLRQSFAGYVSPGVMEEIVAGRLAPETQGTQRYVCVLFSDIRGYTARSEGMKPAEVLAFLNRYFEGVVPIIHRHGGTVVSFMGDGIMAVFGAPQAMASPSEAAFNAARHMLLNLARLNRELSKEGNAPFDIGIGLHAGEAVVGHIGGSQRYEYSAIGDVTNVAARIEGLTKDHPYQLVLSAEVARHLPSRAGLVPLGPISLKGHTPVEAHGFAGEGREGPPTIAA